MKRFLLLWLLPLVTAVGLGQSFEGEGGSTADPSPPPSPWKDEAAIRLWVEQTVTETPPAGGIVTMEKHWPLHYAKNEKVGEIWIVPALVKVVMSKEEWDHEMVFCVFHVDTGVSDVEVDFQVPEDKVDKYRDGADAKNVEHYEA
jgi:hypothetical protein